ncbi:MAG: ImmA/IrrE family metallo-endopeptidase [Arcobacter sp.]|uniref:ImmA/IrrE family metallo-endopeptidase n=1 Tax=Arcobacter sp. TaxID=1872629 RepID=UPI003C7101C2
MFSKNLDNFEVISSGNDKLFSAIQYIENNIDAVKLKKIINSGLTITSKMDLIPFIMEMDSFDGALFRQTQSSDDVLTAIWVSKVKSLAEEKLILSGQYTNSYKLIKDDLLNFSQLSIDENNLNILSKYLLDNFGIFLVFVNNITGMKTDAVSFKLESGHYVIGMSLRINLYDSFWFTLMHELSHICLHDDILNEPHLDYFDKDDMELDDIEVEANLSARFSLIPRKIWTKCKARRSLKEKDIFLFSEEYKINPIIVAGFIRFEQNKYTLFNSIIRSVDVRKKLQEQK